LRRTGPDQAPAPVRYDPLVAWKTFGQSFVTLLVILDPLGNIPLFLALTHEDEPRARSRAAYVSVLVAGAVLAGFAAFGDALIRYLSISLASLMVAGGVRKTYWRVITLLVVGAVAFAAAPALATTVFFARGASSPFAGTRFDGELDAATNRIYSLGFRTTGGGTDGSVWYYDVASKTYTDTGVDMPVPISNYGIAALTDPTGLGFYVFGGRDANGNIVTTVQAYYPATNTTAVFVSDPWPGKTPSGCVSLPAMGVATLGNQAIVMGGSSFAANGCLDENSAQTWMFDPMAAAGSRWTQGGDLNVARGYITPAVLGNKVYAIGGDLNIAGSLFAQQTVEASTGGPWDDAGVADLPEGCDESQAFGFSGGPLANSIILAGCGQWPNAVPDVLQYDSVGNAWAVVGRLTDNRRNHAGSWLGAVGNSPMYILGGYGEASSFIDPIQTSEIGPALVRPTAAQTGSHPSFPRTDRSQPTS